jgi:hypothetical protein
LFRFSDHKNAKDEEFLEHKPSKASKAIFVFEQFIASGENTRQLIKVNDPRTEVIQLAVPVGF